MLVELCLIFGVKLLAVNFAGVVLFLLLRAARKIKTESPPIVGTGGNKWKGDATEEDQPWIDVYFMSLSLIPLWGPILAMMLKDTLAPKRD